MNLSLFHCDIDHAYHNIIKELYLKESLEFLKNGQLDVFDAIVGETSCQIRAVKIAKISKIVAIKGIQGISEKDLEYLLLSRALTKSKHVVRGSGGEIILQKLDPKAITHEISTQKLRKLIVYAQRRLAQLSVEFLQETAFLLNDNEAITATNYVLIDDELHHQRKNCASYAGMKVLLDFVIKEKIVLLLRIYDVANNLTDKPIDLFYRAEHHSLKLIDESLISEAEPIIILEGCSSDKLYNHSKLMSKIQKINIYDIILAFFAKHNQFVGKHRNEDLPYQALGLHNLSLRKKQHEILAELEGCSWKNKSLVCLTHIYASSIAQLTGKVLNTSTQSISEMIKNEESLIIPILS